MRCQKCQKLCGSESLPAVLGINQNYLCVECLFRMLINTESASGLQQVLLTRMKEIVREVYSTEVWSLTKKVEPLPDMGPGVVRVIGSD